MLVWTEAVFLVLIALYLLIRGLTSELTEGDALFAEVIFALVGAVGLFFAGRGFIAQRYFGRGATVLANLIALGVAFYTMRGPLNGLARLVTDLDSAATELSTAADQISQVSQTLSVNASQSAKAIESTASAIEQI